MHRFHDFWIKLKISSNYEMVAYAGNFRKWFWKWSLRQYWQECQIMPILLATGTPDCPQIKKIRSKIFLDTIVVTWLNVYLTNPVSHVTLSAESDKHLFTIPPMAEVNNTEILQKNQRSKVCFTLLLFMSLS